MEPSCKFNASQLFSGNLSASSNSPLLRDHQINTHRDLNHSQHLLSNCILFLMHIVNSGNFPKVSAAMSSLINNKTQATKQKQHKGKILNLLIFFVIYWINHTYQTIKNHNILFNFNCFYWTDFTVYLILLINRNKRIVLIWIYWIFAKVCVENIRKKREKIRPSCSLLL